MQMVSYSDARVNLEAMMDKVVAGRTPILITRKRGGNVVLMSASTWAGMEETLYLLASPANSKRLLVSIAGFDAGERVESGLIRPHPLGDEIGAD